jgi:hypothetical protein
MKKKAIQEREGVEKDLNFDGVSDYVNIPWKELCSKKQAKQEFEEWIKDLKAAIRLLGGAPDDRWRKSSLQEVFEDLYPSGIHICFRLDPDKFYRKTFGPSRKCTNTDSLSCSEDRNFYFEGSSLVAQKVW